MSKSRRPAPYIQYAALPWRTVKGMPEVLLITTRNTKRWIVPKGWPLADHSPSECAAYEALEEAGVVGEVSTEAIGSFRYDKERKSGDTVRCKVYVFAMEVSRRRRRWQEKKARETLWCSVEKALSLITEPGLRRLLTRFRKQYFA